MIDPAPGLLVTPSIRLVRPLGEGGMGQVWLADHTALHTQVVVKFMAADLEHSGDAAARFSREAKAASQVKSPHVVQMLDYGVMDGGAPYIVMELLEGQDLSTQITRSGAISPRDAVGILAQLARALAKAHERGIVHRDIKPSNIFLCDVGGGETFVKLLDFGIAKAGDIKLEGSTTRTGSVMGSPFYMSPEQVIGSKDIDFRSDLWSVGVVAFEMLTGKKPFVAETVGALALKIHRDPLPSAVELRPELPSGVDTFFAKALAREPAERFAGIRELADAFAMAATGEGLAPGLAVDSKPTRSTPPLVSATARTVPVESTTLRSTHAKGAGGRATTGVTTGTGTGVGISVGPPTGRVPRVALVAAGVGFLGAVIVLSRLGAGGAHDPASPAVPSAAASMGDGATITAEAGGADAAGTSGGLASASAIPTSVSPPAPAPRPAAAGQRERPGARPSAPAPTHAASAAPAVSSPPPKPAVPPGPAHGSDDDIK